MARIPSSESNPPLSGMDDRAFTLVELLVVVVIIGILGAIAIPAFLNQQSKGNDADAKANAKYLVIAVESCYVGSDDYSACNSTSALGGLSVSYGSAPGEVQVAVATKRSYQVEAVSQAATKGVNHRFSIKHNQDGTTERSCTTGTSGNDGGGCASGAW